MTNIHKKMLAFHDEKVTLPKEEQDEMRDRREANRNRIKNSNLPKREFKSQGSYAMHTMVQQPDKDYDIDDGLYFDSNDLDDKTPAKIKQEVCEALQDNKFNKKPEVCKKCVRVHYNEGYHIDIPVYRKTKDEYGNEDIEVASNRGWEKSDPDKVTEWFCDAVKNKDEQLRRITRLLKFFGRSRKSWKDKIATGLMISKLIVDNYQYDNSDSNALKQTMVSIKNHMEINDCEIYHPIIKTERLTEGDKNRSRAKLFLEKLEWAIGQLDTCADELEAWDTIFGVKFFCDDSIKRAELEVKKIQLSGTASKPWGNHWQ